MEPKPNEKTAPARALPYAQAAFDMARDLGAVDDWQEKLSQLNELMLDPEIRNMPHDPNLDPETVRNIMDVVLDDLDVSLEQRGFVGLLIEEGKLSLIPWIYDGFLEERRKAEQGPEVTVMTARKLDEMQRDNLAAMLKTHFKTNAEPKVKVDKSLSSGFRIAIGGRVYDQSESKPAATGIKPRSARETQFQDDAAATPKAARQNPQGKSAGGKKKNKKKNNTQKRPPPGKH